MANGFAILRSNRFEGLRQLLVEWLRTDPLAPLENEVVLVQNQGMGQWLKMALAEPDALGIAAAIDTPLPAQFLWQAYRTVLADEALPEYSPYDRAALTWRLTGLLPTLLDDPRFAPLKRYLDHDDEPQRRFQLARQLASLYDQYQVFRADWLEDWANGGSTAAEHYPWQPELWRRIVASVPQAQRSMSRAFIHRRFIEKLASMDTPPPGLPRRIIVFGVTSLPRQFVEGLGALAKFCQVFMLVNDPSPEYWSGKDAHPLLASWGRQGADYLDLLTEFESADLRLELFHDPREDGDSALTQLQSSMFRLESEVAAPADDSIAFHIAHSPQRELEVLHDELLARFEADPTLQPRDIVVMVPDIDAYAPHVHAAFTRIPYGIADRRLRAVNPVLKALEWLLAMPYSRFGVNEVLDLLDVGAVRRRFDLHEDELTQLRELATGANIRWGLDAAQRHTLDLPDGFEQNSWRFGLQRMLLGYACGEAQSWHGIEPYPEVDGQAAEPVGKLIALLETLSTHWQALCIPKSPADWADALRAMLSDVFRHQGEDELRTMIRLHEALDRLEDDCALAEFEGKVPCEVVASAWLNAVEDRRHLGRFLQGQVTVCTLMPMRSIPFRMVCLLGMNDGDFPRVVEPQDFDLLARREHYRPGDRSRRDDDRFQFLEAVLAAREHLHVSWVGRSIRDNAERPASVLVSQLMQFLGDPPVRVHPLQPFSDAYFDGSGTHTTYADSWNPPPARTVSQSTPLPALVAETPYSVSDLAAFLRQPVKFFLNRRFGVRVPEQASVTEELEPIQLSRLDDYSMRENLLEGRTTAAQLQRSGALAAGFIGAAYAEDVENEVTHVRDTLERMRAAYGAELEPVTVHQERAGLVIHDDISGLLAPGSDGVHGLLFGTANPLRDKDALRLHRLTGLWAQHLLLSAQGIAVRTVAVGSDTTLVFGPQDAADADAILESMVTTLARGLCEPLPIECRSALRAYDDENQLDLEAARDTYDGQGNQAGQSAWASEVARFYPLFADMEARGFAATATALYTPMVVACR